MIFLAPYLIKIKSIVDFKTFEEQSRFHADKLNAEMTIGLKSLCEFLAWLGS